MTPDQLLPPRSPMDLPRPVPSQEAGTSPEEPAVLKQGTEVNPEFLPANASPVAQPQPATQPVAPQPQTPPAQHGDNSLAAAAISATAHSPELAEDVDLIEKEWVEKAKAIVSQTKDDPHKQNKEINKMKAVYIKKRYNRDIQVGE